MRRSAYSAIRCPQIGGIDHDTGVQRASLTLLMIIKLDPANAFSAADEPGNFTTGQNGRAMFPGVEHVGCRKAKRVDGAIGDLNGAEQSRIHGRLNTQRFRWRQLAGLDTGLLTGADKGLLPGQVVLGKGDKQSVSGLNTVAGDAAQDAVFTDAFPGRFAIGYGIARAAVQQPMIAPGRPGGDIMAFH